MPKRRNLASKIANKEDFKRLLDAVISDLGRVNDNLTLFRSLARAQTTYWRGMSYSQAFWSTTMGALQDAALYGLARAYDQDDDALSLRTLLETIETPAAFLTRTGDFDVQQLELDLAFAHRDTNQPVRHLMMWRHKFFAHRDPIKILNGQTLADDYPLTWEDIDSLVETGFRIANRYGIEFFNSSTLRHVHGHKDYLRTLKILQAHGEAAYANVNEQLQRAAAEAAAATGE